MTIEQAKEELKSILKDYDYDWQTRTDSNWRMINRLTKEIRPITQEQYEDERFTLNMR